MFHTLLLLLNAFVCCVDITHTSLCTPQELVEYRNKYLGPTPPPILALGLSSRKNLCIHPQVAGARLHTRARACIEARTYSIL